MPTAPCQPAQEANDTARTGLADLGPPHPYIGRAAVAAIVFAMLAIVWARVEVLGTRDLERTLNEESVTLAQVCIDRLQALAFNRWATGFSQ